jgi:response regulator RpfG family c-di-GMP phosphodiesterase
MYEDPRPRVLCVDDEPNVLEGLSRTLRTLFVVETAVGGSRGLDVMREQGPFTIVLSDLRMPRMTGVEFLSKAKELAPDTVRVLLTGQADLEATISAVNEGNIFRFLTKPCPTGMLVKSLMACAEQNRLLTAERVLLEQTLRGSVKALTDILSLTNPAAFGRATRVRRSVIELMDHFEVKEQWPVEVAAMLSQIGFVILPPITQERLYAGEDLSDSEWEMLGRVPKVVEQLLANIPRLDLVREILRSYAKNYVVDNGKPRNVHGEQLPWGSRALKIIIDYDILESQRNSNRPPLDVLRDRTGWYDPEILEAFAKLRGLGKEEMRIRELPISGMSPGMIFGDDVKSAKGLLLVARGQEVTPSLLERIQNFSSELGIREPIRMVERLADTAKSATSPGLQAASNRIPA